MHISKSAPAFARVVGAERRQEAPREGSDPAVGLMRGRPSTTPRERLTANWATLGRPNQRARPAALARPLKPHTPFLSFLPTLLARTSRAPLTRVGGSRDARIVKRSNVPAQSSPCPQRRVGAGWASLSQLGRYRAVLAVVVLVMTSVKLLLAARTFGSTDVGRWMKFAAGVARAGPVGVYHKFQGSHGHHHLHLLLHHHHHPHHLLYNHPPLIGYLLLVVNAATRRGVWFPLAIRIPAISADVVTPFLVFELIRRRRSLQSAFVAAAAVAASPALLVGSGYHGNTDAVFIMFSLLSVYLLVDRRAPGLAGLAIAIALGVKLVPVVVVPTLIAFAVRVGWRFVLRFVVALGTFLALTWTPVILREWQPFRQDVLGYAGGHKPPWGFVQLGTWVGQQGWVTWFDASGRFVVVLVVALLPAALVLSRPRLVVEASAFAMVGLLALSPAFAFQYVAWAVAPAYLLMNFWPATAFNLFASYLLIEIYNRWSGGYPWYLATPRGATSVERVALFGVWVTLLIVLAAGFWQIIRSPQPAPTV